MTERRRAQTARRDKRKRKRAGNWVFTPAGRAMLDDIRAEMEHTAPGREYLAMCGDGPPFGRFNRPCLAHAVPHCDPCTTRMAELARAHLAILEADDG